MDNEEFGRLRAYLDGVAGGSCTLPFDRMRELTGQPLPEEATSEARTGGMRAQGRHLALARSERKRRTRKVDGQSTRVSVVPSDERRVAGDE